MTIYREDLEAVYKLIEKPERWTQGEFARTAFGERTDPSNNEAACWCLWGACVRTGTEELSPIWANVFGVKSVIRFNDAPERTHAEVLELLRSAISRSPSREGVERG